MILETLSGVVTWFFGLVFDSLSIVSLPINAVTVLLNIMKYGIWVLGLDLWILCWSSILGWIFFKLTSGLVLFIWRLLPLT